MRIYQVIKCSGEWEDYHEWVVYSTFDRKRAHYIKSVLANHEEMLKSQKPWDAWYDPSWYRVDSHEVDKTEDYALELVLRQRGKLKSPIFRSKGDITND